MKIATWNVHSRNFNSNHLDFLQSFDLDILLLQEVRWPFYQALQQAHLFSTSAFSLEHYHPESSSLPSHNLGCAVFTSSSCQFRNCFVLESLPFPERSLIANLTMDGKGLTVCSFHTPPGASWGKKKPESHVTLARWLASSSGKVILGIDANAPKVDHPDLAKNEWWWKDEPLLLGFQPLHHLKDAYRVYLKEHPDQLEMIQKNQPNGPLAVSFIRGNSRKWTPSRYDFIYITPDIQVDEVRYFYQQAVKAGSDHALVLAELTI